MLTHGGREDNNAQDVHLLATARTRLVHDLWRGGQFQIHRLSFRVILIRDDVHKVRLDGSGRDFEDRNQVCFVLKTHRGSEACRVIK